MGLGNLEKDETVIVGCDLTMDVEEITEDGNGSVVNAIDNMIKQAKSRLDSEFEYIAINVTVADKEL